MINLLKSIYKHVKFSLARDLIECYELGSEAKEWVLPRNLPADNADSCVPAAMLGDSGLDLNISKQLEKLRYWREHYKPYFEAVRRDPNINTWFMGKDYLHNGYYPTPDAEIYSAMILDHKPSRIIEVGSGFSTLIAKKTVETAHMDTAIEAIDQAPRTDVAQAVDKVMLQYVEDVAIDEINITKETLLFIDSSHICRASGDIPYLFCQIIPRLPSGVIVHVHHIFMPYDYPVIYKRRMYTEQYVLHALLAHSPRYKILFTSHYMSRSYLHEMQETFGSIVGTDKLFWGASIWFQVT